MNEKQFKIIAQKAQTVRLWDVFFLGPFMLYAGIKKSRLHSVEKIVLTTAGILTILYNGRNYLINRELEK